MKTFVTFVLLTFAVTVFAQSTEETTTPPTTTTLPSTPSCSASPTNGMLLCNFCRSPICGLDVNYAQPMWFNNNCYLRKYNIRCGTNFSKVSASVCNNSNNPASNSKPASGKPCLWNFNS